MGVAQSVYFNKHWFRFQDVLVASPVSPLSYAFGLALSTLIAASPALALSFVILLLSKPVGLLAFLAVIAVSLLMWLAMVFIGYVIGLTTKNTRRANSIPQVFGFLLGFLPPVYYPLSMLPGFLQPVAMLVPSTHAAQLAKYYFGMIPLSSAEILIGWAYMVGFVALMAALTLRKARWVDP
jgi:ABC-2 type transport system permease protein